MQTEITKQCSHYYVKSSENTFVYVLIATLCSDHIYLFRKYELYVEWTDYFGERSNCWVDLSDLEWSDHEKKWPQTQQINHMFYHH